MEFTLLMLTPIWLLLVSFSIISWKESNSTARTRLEARPLFSCFKRQRVPPASWPRKVLFLPNVKVIPSAYNHPNSSLKINGLYIAKVNELWKEATAPDAESILTGSL